MNRLPLPAPRAWSGEFLVEQLADGWWRVPWDTRVPWDSTLPLWGLYARRFAATALGAAVAVWLVIVPSAALAAAVVLG